MLILRFSDRRELLETFGSVAGWQENAVLTGKQPLDAFVRPLHLERWHLELWHLDCRRGANRTLHAKGRTSLHYGMGIYLLNQ